MKRKKVYVPKTKAGFIVFNVSNGMYLKKTKTNLLTRIVTKAAYDFYEDKRGAAIFTREKALRVINHLRQKGYDVKLKPVGKKILGGEEIK